MKMFMTGAIPVLVFFLLFLPGIIKHAEVSLLEGVMVWFMVSAAPAVVGFMMGRCHEFENRQSQQEQDPGDE